jgi:MYXO-CTERM domain-containing protein
MSLNPGSRAGIDILSDVNFTVFSNPSRPDGYTSLDKFTFNYVGGTSETFSTQFFDRGDVLSAVPEAGSTWGLLLLSLGALLCLRYRRIHS